MRYKYVSLFAKPRLAHGNTKKNLTKSLFCTGLEPLYFCLYGVWALWFTRRLASLTNFLKAAGYSMVNLKLPTSCPHSLYMCFLWISEQTAIISLYSINWLVFSNQEESVYCAVRTECLYIIQVNIRHYTTTAGHGSSTGILVRDLIWPNATELLKAKAHFNKLQLFQITVLQVISKLPRVTSTKSLQQKTGNETEKAHVIRVAYKLYFNKWGYVLIK